MVRVLSELLSHLIQVLSCNSFQYPLVRPSSYVVCRVWILVHHSVFSPTECWKSSSDHGYTPLLNIPNFLTRIHWLHQAFHIPNAQVHIPPIWVSGHVHHQRISWTYSADCQGKGPNRWWLQMIYWVVINSTGTEVNGKCSEKEWVQIFSSKLRI